jgi:hypothetical protein
MVGRIGLHATRYIKPAALNMSTQTNAGDIRQTVESEMRIAGTGLIALKPDLEQKLR